MDSENVRLRKEYGINSEPKLIVLAGGGTGGHLFPGVAVGEAICQRWPGCRCLFVGTGREIERIVLQPLGLEAWSLPTEPLPQLTRSPWRFFAGNLRALFLAEKWLRELRPDAVIGLGGYAGWPLLSRAPKHGIPTILLEQNVIPGRTTRWFARAVNAVCTSFEASHAALSKARRLVCTGNPVRAELAEFTRSDLQSPELSATPTLLVLGGSQGAHGVNDMLLAALAADPERFRSWRIWHQTGVTQQALVERRYREWALNADVQAFFNDMPARYRAATLAVSRAGATSLAELACVGCPAILVPYPLATDNHQLKNAELFLAANAARIVIQTADAAANGAALQRALVEIAHQPSRLEEMSTAMKSLARPDAATAVVNELARWL